MSECIRILDASDIAALERFFERHPHTTLFFQGNLSLAGIEDRGERYQGSWAAVIDDAGEIGGLAVHFWQGNLILECPHPRLADVARLAVARSGRALTGLLGPDEQVCAAREVLGAARWNPALDSHEHLFALALQDLRVPEPLRAGQIACRVPSTPELARLTQWRVAYALEILGATAGAALERASEDAIHGLQRLGRQWVVVEGDALVAYSAFNAATPHCVQVGGVFTPAHLRGRGYARAVVAGSLLEARGQGVRDAVLFTPRENHAAQRAYRSLGFERVGNYALMLF